MKKSYYFAPFEFDKGKYFGHQRTPRGLGRNKQISGKRGRNRSFLLFSTKKQGRNKEKVGEEIRVLAKIFTLVPG